MRYPVPMSKTPHLGQHFIRQWREYRGYSLRKLAAMMEIEPGVQLTSHSNIGRIETFQQPYSQDILEALAVALRCEVVSLLTVNPLVEGEVVDMTALLKGAPELVRQQAVAAARAVLQTGTGRTVELYRSDAADNGGAPEQVGRTTELRSTPKR